jgi:hypothetical protein
MWNWMLVVMFMDKARTFWMGSGTTFRGDLPTVATVCLTIRHTSMYVPIISVAIKCSSPVGTVYWVNLWVFTQLGSHE